VKNIILVAACLVLFLPGCKKSDDDPVIITGKPQTPMADDTSVIFLHHSTGSVIWNGGVDTWFTSYNSTNSTSYAITEQAYPNTPYPWDNYPYDYWLIWVSNAGPTPYDGQDTLEILAAAYDVIVFKHCFPVSQVGLDTGSPDVSSSTKSQENYKLQYQTLKAKMLSFPNNRFIVWTGAALVESATDALEADRARSFFNWVKNEWDEPGDNIYVWDFWQLETGGGLYLLGANAVSSSDSHPNSTFATTVAPYFSQRVVNVIKGLGDLTSLTGQ